MSEGITDEAERLTRASEELSERRTVPDILTVGSVRLLCLTSPYAPQAGAERKERSE